MIYFLTTGRHDYTIRRYLTDVGSEYAHRIRPMSYGQLRCAWSICRKVLTKGTYIFSDIERLSIRSRQKISQIRRQLQLAGSQVLNDPATTLDRFMLLARLYEMGINDFRAHWLSGDLSGIRYPAFLRCDWDHKGTLSEPIASEQALRKAAARLRTTIRGRRVNLAIEFVESKDPRGIYRKYSAMRVGRMIVPRHLFFGNQWHVKAWKLMEPELLEEERQYLKQNPHESELRQIFDVANVQYGRIDYAVVGGRIQVWEINTNPVLPVRFGDGGEARRAVGDFFHPRLAEAFDELSLPNPVTKIAA